MADIRTRLTVVVDGEGKLKAVEEGFAKVDTGAKKAQGSVTSFATAITQGIGQGLGQKAFDAMAGSLSRLSGEFMAQTARVTSFADKVTEMSVASGLSAENIQVWGETLKEAGKGPESLTIAATKLRKNIYEANAETVHAISKIGLSISDLKKQSPDEQFNAIARAVGAIANPTTQAGVAMQLFGKSGNDIASIVPMVDEINDRMEKFAYKLSNEQVAAVHDMSEAWENLGRPMEGFFNQVVAGIASSESLHQSITGVADVLSTLSTVASENKDTIRELVDTGVLVLATTMSWLVNGALAAGVVGFKVFGEVVIRLREEYRILTAHVQALGEIWAKGAWAAPKALTDMNRRIAEAKEDTKFARKELDEMTLAGAQGALKVAGSFDKLRDSIKNAQGQIHESSGGKGKGAPGIGFGTAAQAAAVEKERAARLDAERKAMELAASEELRLKESNAQAILKVEQRIYADGMKWQADQQKMAMDKANAMGKAFLEQAEQGRKAFMSPEAWDTYNKNMDRAIASANRMRDLFGTLREGLTALGFGAESFAMKLAVGLEMGSATKSAFLDLQKNNGSKLQYAQAGAGALVGAYKSGSFLGGAASGAMAGSAFGPVGTAIGGFVGGIAGLFGKKSHKKQMEEKYKDVDAGDFFSQMAAKTEYATKDFLTLMNAAKGTAQHTEWIAKNLGTAGAGVARMVDAMEYLGPEGGAAVAGAFSHTFSAMVKEQGLVAATEAMRPAYEKMLESIASLGLDAQALGLGGVGRLMGMTADPKTAALLGAASGNAQYMQGMLNSGYMTGDVMSGSGKIASATYNELRNQGLTEKEGYEQLAEYLSAVQKASEASGEKIPDEIQRMIAEAEKNGIKFTKEPIEQLSGYAKEIRDFLLGKGMSSGGSTTGSVAGAGGSATYDEATGTVDWGPRPSGYPGGAPWPPSGYASGGLVKARRGGTVAVIGEGGEDEYVIPASRIGAMGGGTKIAQHNTYNFSPLQSADSRKELVVFANETSEKSLRNSPLIRQGVQKMARPWRR